MLKDLPVDALHPHPKNPRLAPRKDVVDQIAEQIANGFDQSHALIVRKNAAGYEVVSGHHRLLAARQVKIKSVPCWVREFSDAEAYMQLLLCNTQSELHPLEEGKHAAESGMDLKAYAAAAGKARTTLQDKVKAWKVMSVTDIRHDTIRDSWSNLAAIHAAPEWLWPALMQAMAAGGWTVQNTRERVAQCKEWAEPPQWANLAVIARQLLSREDRYQNIAQMAATVEGMKVSNPDRRSRVMEALVKAAPSSLSEVREITDRAEAEESEETRKRQRASEDATARTGKLLANCSLDDWEKLKPQERAALLSPDNVAGASTFNKQESADIEWAQWSWNPVTGCRHDCSYCYARDIALSARMAKVYPNGFEPTFRANAIAAPNRTKVPAEAATDTRFRNVFTCSMADLFGRWVPKEWIDAVLGSVRANPHWNFLFLTKFPNRMAEFDIPANAWMGTSVDLQARVANAEKAFAKVKCGVRWLSVEPMIEPIKFAHLDRFDWVVIGGASASSRTPEWRPPYRWIESLVRQCDEAGVKVYMKTNLGIANRVLQLPFDAPLREDPQRAPESFHYLGKAND